MSLIFRTFIVPADIADAARSLGECLTPAAANMFNTPLSPTGEAPATHYISSGLIDDVWTAPLSDAAILYGAAQQGAAARGLILTATLTDAQRLLAESDISDEPAGDALVRLGLIQISTPNDGLSS